MAYVSLILILFFLLIAGTIILQIFLSRRENRWPGLILPAISLLISLLVPLNYAAFSVVHETEGTIISENGEIIEQIEPEESAGQGGASFAEVIVPVMGLFLLGNIPTVILAGIYFACQEKWKRRKEIEKMNIQDLE